MIRLSVVVAALGVLLPAQGQAFTVSHCSPIGALRSDADFPLQWYLQEDGYSGLDFNSVRTAVESAFDAWAAPACTDFRHVYSGTTPTSYAADFQNIVVFEENDWTISGSSTVARTLELITSDCRVEGADIVFNAVNYTFVIGQPSVPTEIDLQAIATHEVGHVVGLDHSDTPGSALQTAYSQGLQERTLNQDNIDGVCTLYANPTACSTSGDCGSTQVCNDGVCERECFNDDFCEAPRTCDLGTNRCLPKTCSDNTQCDAGESCSGGECVLDNTCGVCRSCVNDADCQGGEICSTALGPGICTAVCGPTTPCPGDAGCFNIGAPTPICLNDDADTTAGPCPAGYVCDSCLGVVCTGSTTCDPADGLCKTPCELANCGPTQICDPLSGTCSAGPTPDGGPTGSDGGPTGGDNGTPAGGDPTGPLGAGGCAAVPGSPMTVPLWLLGVVLVRRSRRRR